MSRAKAVQNAKEAAQCAVTFDLALASFTVATFDGPQKEALSNAIASSLEGVDPAQVLVQFHSFTPFADLPPSVRLKLA